jgi:hypothetical protein
VRTTAEVYQQVLSGELTRERCCDGKAAYWSHKYAEQRREALQTKYGKQYDIYPCPFCGKWHMATERK